MEELISPKYHMQLIDSVEKAIFREYITREKARLYIDKWHVCGYDEPSSPYANNYWENFEIVLDYDNEINLNLTLHGMSGTDVLKIAIDLGVDTPDFIPSIPTFKNSLKTDYKTAYDTFSQALRLINTEPSISVGLANSALESIIKEILKDERISSKIKGNETLHKLTGIILNEFKIIGQDHPIEFKTIGSSLLALNSAIERLRSETTNFHGKTESDFLINDPVYTYFIINSATTVGLFLISFYKTKFPNNKPSIESDDLPF